MKELAEGVLRGEPGAASRALTWVVDERAGHEELWRRLYPHSGRAHKVGFFGPPGSGKSSLIGAMIALLRARGEKVGVLAVDPTSPFTGGAFLGDRLRLQEHVLDRGVFMRSLASRGTLGGLTAGIFGAIRVLEAYGCDRILIETVGTGQDEVEVAKVVDSVILVTTPFLGDEIQGLKAGSMEIADLFIINKADLEGSDRALGDLRRALAMGEEKPGAWKPPVIAASATQGRGLDEILKALTEHAEFLKSSGEGARRRKAQAFEELSIYVTQRVYQDVRKGIKEAHLNSLLEKRTDPVSLGRALVAGRKAKRSKAKI